MPAFPFAIAPRNLNNLLYAGSGIGFMPAVEFPRAPRVSDVNYPLFTIWRNSNPNAISPDAIGDMWYLAYAFFSGGTQEAKWLKLAGANGGPLFMINVPLGSNPVTPDSNGLMTYTSTGGTLAITGSLNAINFDVVGAGDITWQTIIASQALQAKHGYICITPGANLSLNLPATAVIGDTIEIVLDGSTSWTIVQAAGQQIRFGQQLSTLGVVGSISSNAQGDWITLVAETNTRWLARAESGNFTVT
jgi:hypothetical protein